jgi:hypothetical protein
MPSAEECCAVYLSVRRLKEEAKLVWVDNNRSGCTWKLKEDNTRSDHPVKGNSVQCTLVLLFLDKQKDMT